jgi:hypothetical protein
MQEAFDQVRAAGVPGVAYEAKCRGCAPRECRDGSMICDRCFGRMRGLLSDARDLLGRLRAIADPSKATPLDQVRVASSSVEPAAPVSADLLDAIGAVEQAVEWAYVDLAEHTNDLDTVIYLSALILNRHPETDGLRHAWSLQDAVDRWGVERVDHNPQPWEDDDERLEVIEPVSEWLNPIVGRDDAEGLAGSASTLRRWIKDGDVTPVGEVYIAGVRTRLFRRAELVACRERMQGRMNTGRPKRSHDA